MHLQSFTDVSIGTEVVQNMSPRELQNGVVASPCPLQKLQNAVVPSPCEGKSAMWPLFASDR